MRRGTRGRPATGRPPGGVPSSEASIARYIPCPGVRWRRFEATMTAATRARRSSAWAAVLGIALAAGLVPVARAAEPQVASSRLEAPMVDIPVIDPPGGVSPDPPPMLLVLD